MSQTLHALLFAFVTWFDPTPLKDARLCTSSPNRACPGYVMLLRGRRRAQGASTRTTILLKKRPPPRWRSLLGRAPLVVYLALLETSRHPLGSSPLSDCLPKPRSKQGRRRRRSLARGRGTSSSGRGSNPAAAPARLAPYPAKATVDGGRVGSKGGPLMVVSVTDSGPGISPADVAR